MKRPRHLKDLPAKKAAAAEKRRIAKDLAEKARFAELQRIAEYVKKHGVPEPEFIDNSKTRWPEDPLDLTEN